MTMETNEKTDDGQDGQDGQDEWDPSYFQNAAFAADPVSKSWDSTFDAAGFLDEDSVDKDRVECDSKVYADCFCNQLRQHLFIRRLERYAGVDFNWRTFTKEFLYHLFFPFSIPLMLTWEGGMNSLINRQFWGFGKISIAQWILSICFFMVNGLTPFYVSPDLVIADVLYLMRTMILATKYGFIHKGEMLEMRNSVLPMQVHKDRTLVLAWTNPIPPTVLKKELLLAAIRKDLIRCTAAVRLLPGASMDAVRSIMHQVSMGEPKDDGDCHTPTQGSGWGDSLDHELGLDQTFRHCPACVKHKCTKDRLEDRWINLSMAKIGNDPGMLIPKDVNGRFVGDDESAQSSHRSEYEGSDRPCSVVDLPALMVAAFTIQKAGELLKKKIFLHQIFSSPWRVYWTSAFVGLVHAIIPFATRGIAGHPSAFGGPRWYYIVVSGSSFAINYSAMSACVTFMLAGSADFRRRYFSSRLLNTMLKDGWFGEDKTKPKKSQKLKQQKLLQMKSVYHLGLTIDFSEPRSMAGWWAVRVLVHDFGMVFHMRVRQYATYFATYCALLMGFLIVELFANGASTAVYILTVVVFDLVIFLFLLCLMVFPGGEANDMNHEHGASLVRKKMLISNQLHRSDSEVHSEDRSVLRAALEVLQSVSQAVYWDNATNKVTILGFTAGGELIAVLIGFGSAAIGIAAQQLTSQIGG